MARFLLTRLIQSVATLILLSLVIFVLARATGDPLTLILPMVATRDGIWASTSHCTSNI